MVRFRVKENSDKVAKAVSKKWKEHVKKPQVLVEI